MTVPQQQKARLQRLALASGLVTAEQWQAADRAVRAADRRIGSMDETPEDQVAAQLIVSGVLNQWQVAQLKNGRTKFTLGPYQIIESIGEGGMGQVFKGVHTIMGRVVAIKVLPRHKATPTAINCFTREIRAQAQFDHENLVRAFDAGYDGNVYYLVCEYVPGTDLRRLVRSRGKLSAHDAATIVSQAAHGLMHAHVRGLIHRDVKPGNLLVTPEGLTKVSDLGLAGFLDRNDEDPDPRAGKVVGTADYLAPEQVLTPDGVTQVADIYALGVTLYYAVTGKVPFAGGTARDKARRHLEEPPLNPRRLTPELPEEFVTVIAAMMEKRPADRIQTAEEVMKRLAPWARAAMNPFAGELAREAPGDSRLPTSVAPPVMGEGTPAFFGEPLYASDGSSSQISQGTDPINAALEQTTPDALGHPLATGKRSRLVLGLVIVALTPLMLGAGLLLTALVLEAMR